ncbi:MAG: Nucleoside-diphosphate-sugar epimerase [Bacteroidetes bacterium]|nr:Nucleoside-diphosphate-sugar epimerase [Bacteroidota bacterium]
MSYLIFGGSGFIGTHLVNLLHEQYPAAKIYNLDIVESNHGGKSTFVHCDVRKEIELYVPLSAEDVIFNFSAVHRTPGHPDRDYFETNIRGAEHVTDFAEKHDIRKIVFTSSIAPYGASEELKEETTLTTPNTPYGISKLVAEKIHGIWQAKNQQERQLTIVRPGVVFGTGENGNFTRLYWGIRCRRFFYPGRKDTIKACMYVKELVRFMLYRLEYHQEGVELYNCTYEPAFTIEQICHAMMGATGLKRRLVMIPGGLLIGVAAVVGALGGRALGIHPARVKKLMVSTNISGKKLAASGYKFHYTFEEAVEDWFKDNERKGLR